MSTDDSKCLFSTLSKFVLQFGEFDVEKILGCGSFGKVYLVNCKKGHKYVLKVSSSEHKGMLEAEFEVGKSILHPCIIRPLKLFEVGVFTCLLFEYIPSLSLEDYLKAKSRSKKEKIMLVYQLVLAIAHLHFVCKIAHFDLKPDNILVFIDKNGFPVIKIIDFGLACLIKKFEEEEPKGTPHWMAPEVVKGEYDEKADIWSLGKIIAWMFTGRNIFLPGDNPIIVMLFHIANIITPPIPEQLKTNPKLASVLLLCEACLAIDPKSRASAMDLVKMCASMCESQKSD